MQLSANLTKKDYSAFRRYAMFRLRKTWLIYLPLVAFVAWSSFPTDYAESGTSLLFAAISSLVIGLTAAGIALLLSLAVIAVLPNKPGTVLGEHVFTLTDSQLQENSDSGFVSMRLDLLRRHETAQHVFLLTPTHLCYIVPKRALQSAPEFLRILRERTKRA